MKDTIRLLCEGWYGNGHIYSQDHPDYKGPVDRSKLWDTCIEVAGTIFVKICKGISGSIGGLIIDNDYKTEDVKLSIDTLVVNLTPEANNSNENWVGEDDFSRSV